MLSEQSEEIKWKANIKLEQSALEHHDHNKDHSNDPSCIRLHDSVFSSTCRLDGLTHKMLFICFVSDTDITSQKPSNVENLFDPRIE